VRPLGIRLFSGVTRGSHIWQPFCAHSQFRLVEDTVEAFDNAWLLPPQDGEVFATAKEYLARPQGFALSRAFAVVTRGSDKERARFLYIHRGEEAKNWRKLEQQVERDPNNDKKIISKR